MGVEALRYFLLREVVFGQDGSFSYDALVGRYNSDLANGLGNLASRTLTMIKQYRDGVIPQAMATGDIGGGRRRNQSRLCLGRFRRTSNFPEASKPSGRCSRPSTSSSSSRRPGSWRRRPASRGERQLDCTLYTAAETLRIVTALLHPVLPESHRQDLGAARHDGAARIGAARSNSRGASLHAGQKIGDDRRRLPAHRSEERHRQDARRSKTKKRRRQAVAAGQDAGAAGGRSRPPPSPKSPSTISSKWICASARCSPPSRQRRRQADAHEGRYRRARAAHHRGRHRRGLHARDLIGRKVVIVANLQPRKLHGIESNGMIVAASVEGGKPVLAGFLEDIPVGARLK